MHLKIDPVIEQRENPQLVNGLNDIFASAVGFSYEPPKL